MAFDPAKFGLGWNPAAEAQHDAEFAKLTCAAAPITDPIPDEVLPPLPINNQGPIGSCQGNAQAKVLEYDNWLETGVIVKLSARLAYLATKQTDGSLGQGDCGSSISGGAVTASKVGCCKETTFPYWDFANGEAFDEVIKPEALQEGKLHLLRSQCDVPDWNFGQQFVGSGQGGFTFGISWFDSLSHYDGTGIVTRVSGQSHGGHALCVCGYKTEGGQKIPGVRNSWGEEYGDNGILWIDPDLLFKLIRQAGFGAKGMSSLPEFATRRIKHIDGGYR